MPAGDLIEEDYQVEMRGWLAGKNTDTTVRGLEGLLSQATKTADVDLYGDGIFAGTDRYASASKVLTFQWRDQTSPESLQARLDEFAAAWILGGDEELHFQLGGTHFYLVGRTRNYDVDDHERVRGVIEVIAQFMPTDPTLHVVAS